MTLPYSLRPAAEADIEGARNWYEDHRAGLGQDFLDRIEATLRAVAEHPEIYPVVHRDVRRALVRRFPYGLFYVVRGQRVIIVACFHASRDPALLATRFG